MITVCIWSQFQVDSDISTTLPTCDASLHAGTIDTPKDLANNIPTHYTAVERTTDAPVFTSISVHVHEKDLGIFRETDNWQPPRIELGASDSSCQCSTT